MHLRSLSLITATVHRGGSDMGWLVTFTSNNHVFIWVHEQIKTLGQATLMSQTWSMCHRGFSTLDLKTQ